VGVALVADGVAVDDVSGTLDLTAGLLTASSPVGRTWSWQLPGVELVSPPLAAAFTVVGAPVPGQEPSASASASPASPTASP
jgi:hypothetical protein